MLFEEFIKLVDPERKRVDLIAKEQDCFMVVFEPEGE